MPAAYAHTPPDAAMLRDALIFAAAAFVLMLATRRHAIDAMLFMMLPPY